MNLKTGYSYNDITIVPIVISDINSRSECQPVYEDTKRLPIFASCMSTVVSAENYAVYEQNDITPIIPRNVDIIVRMSLMKDFGKWVAVSFKEFKEIFIDNIKTGNDKYGLSDATGKTYYVCVDIANGHMKSLYESCQEAKDLAHSYDLVIMTGNIANPQTYNWIINNYNDAVDYIRVSIGNGAQCLTSSNTGVHYPLASLIYECNEIRNQFPQKAKYPKIVADGGIRNYSDVIKALALGADYVIIGTLFAATYESASPLMFKTACGDIEVCDYIYESEEKKRKDIKNRDLWKECYGMSTKKAQTLIGNTSNKTIKTSEGKHTFLKVKYTLKQWTENMKDYLKSTMSYCGVRKLEDFIGEPGVIINTPGEIMAVNK